MTWHKGINTLSLIALGVGGPIAVSSHEALAQSAVDKGPRYETIIVPRGTELEAVLNQELSTRKNRVGDRFSATLDRPVTNGRLVLLPEGAMIHGHVTAAGKSRESGEKELRLRISAISVYGDTYPIDATIIYADSRTKGTSAGKSALKVGVGAVAGALLGRVIGGNKTGTLVGAAAGAVAGTAVAVGTAGSDAIIDTGAVVRFRLDEPLVVERWLH